MKCLILGGAGFIGLHLSEALLAQGHSVRIFDCIDRNQIEENHRFSKIEWVTGNFLNEKDLAFALEGCDIVYHLISTTLPKLSNDSPIYDVQTNLIGTIQLLSLICKKNLQKIIFVSSGGTIYGLSKESRIKETHATEPLCSYGINKLAIEKYLYLYRILHGLDYYILRLSNPFGERQRTATAQGAIMNFLHKALFDESIEVWGNGEIIRDYIYISDVTDALVKIISYEGDNRIFNIGSGQGRSINDLIMAIEALIGKKLSTKYSLKRSFDVPENVLDIACATQYLNWQPQVPFQEGLLRTWEWLQKCKVNAVN